MSHKGSSLFQMSSQSSVETPNHSKQRLWVISELYYPEETSTGYYLTRIAEGLADDFDVRVISGQPNYSKRGTIAAKHEIRRDVEIFRAAGTRFDKNRIFLRMINMATLGLSVFATAVRKFRRGDRVLVVTTPPNMPFIAAIASLFRGASYTLLIHDNYPDMLVAVGKLRPNSLFVRLMDHFNRWLFKHTSKIIVVGRDMRTLIERKTAGLDIPIAVIPNWAELETVEPLSRNSVGLLDELGIRNKFVFLYAGNMGYPNDLESIVDCAERLSETDAHFVFLGSGVKRKWLLESKERRSLTNVTVLDPRPRSDQSIFLNACDVALVSLVDKMLGVSMPSRTYNILAAGKPIIGISELNSELSTVINEELVGWTVEPRNADELYKVLLEAAAAGPKLGEMGKRARRAAETKYSLEAALSRYKVEL